MITGIPKRTLSYLVEKMLVKDSLDHKPNEQRTTSYTSVVNLKYDTQGIDWQVSQENSNQSNFSENYEEKLSYLLIVVRLFC